VVLFIKPREEDLSGTKVILDVFGEASRLIVNCKKVLLFVYVAMLMCCKSSLIPFSAQLGRSHLSILGSPSQT
jgi:hypothetical protein